jgi:hypothetical protein
MENNVSSRDDILGSFDSWSLQDYKSVVDNPLESQLFACKLLNKNSHGQAQGCQIESKSNRVSLSNWKFLLTSNRIECRSNQMKFSIFDTIRFDLDRKVNTNNSELW